MISMSVKPVSTATDSCSPSTPGTGCVSIRPPRRERCRWRPGSPVPFSPVLVLLPCSLLGGMIFGPFLAGMYAAILRGLRDDLLNWNQAYLRSWRANFRDSLLTGLYAFMARLLWWSRQPVGAGTAALYLLSILLFLLLSTLYWPQMVLLRQAVGNRLRNVFLFTTKHFRRVLGAAALQLAHLEVMVLFAPWTLLLIPIPGFWYILFLSQLMIYEQQVLQIKASRGGEGAGRQRSCQELCANRIADF